MNNLIDYQNISINSLKEKLTVLSKNIDLIKNIDEPQKNHFYEKLSILNRKISEIDNLVNELSVDLVNNESYPISSELKNELKDFKEWDIFIKKIYPYILYQQYISRSN